MSRCYAEWKKISYISEKNYSETEIGIETDTELKDGT